MSQTVDTRTKEAIDDCLRLLKKKGWPELPIDLEPPIGDFAVICFPAAKTLKKEPERIAEELAYELEKMNSVDSTYVEKGYCNVNLRWNEFANDVIDEIKDEEFGKGTGQKEKILIFHPERL